MPARNRDAEGKTAVKKMRGGRIVFNLLLGVVVVIFVIAISFLLLQISGKNSLYSRADDGEVIGTLSDMAVALGGSIDVEEEEDWQEGDFRFEGVHYRYNSDILTFLFMGVDKMSEVQVVRDGIEGGQADANFLLVLDPHSKEITVIAIPRDTMTEVEAYTKEGIHWGALTAQLAVQHGYGDGAEVSCERSVKAVSNLFYGLPIHGYCAINMGAIPLLNDAVGGVDLQAIETLDFGDFRITEGEKLHLEGMDAYYYLHNRDTSKARSAVGRLERQKQYLMAYAVKTMEAIKKDITFPVALYGTLSKYMVTDISVDEVGYLATQILNYSFDGSNMYVLEGETTKGEEYEEFWVDEDALYRLILDVFYEKIE
nr:LCP family protein [uncultured Acetatifactor sp.]